MPCLSMFDALVFFFGFLLSVTLVGYGVVNRWRQRHAWGMGGQLPQGPDLDV